MNFAISWVLGLFKKPQVEVTFKPKPRVRKTRPLPSKATVAKATAKKSIAAKKKAK